MAKNKFIKNKIHALLSPENYIRNKGQSLPIHECLINENWQEMGLATILISRRQPSGNVVSGVYLVDIFCLGLKNTKCSFNLPFNKYEQEYKEMVFEGQVAVRCDSVLAHNIIYGAIEYAEDLGFKPNKDFALSRFILNKDEDVEVLQDLEFGKDGAPFYITGPKHNVNFVIHKLNHVVGEGNYTVLYPDKDSDSVYDSVGIEDDKNELNDDSGQYEDLVKLTDEESGNELILTEYAISYEPMCDPRYEKFKKEAGESKMEELYHLVHKKPLKAIGLLKQTIFDHPNIPSLYNHLAVALERCQMHDEALKVVKTTYEKFPDYFFGKINYLSFLIKDGKIDEVREILDNKFDIKSQCPERKIFHISEVTCFTVMMVSYLIALNNIEAAQSYFNKLKSLDPKHKHLKRLKLEFKVAKQNAKNKPNLQYTQGKSISKKIEALLRPA